MSAARGFSYWPQRLATAPRLLSRKAFICLQIVFVLVIAIYLTLGSEAFRSSKYGSLSVDLPWKSSSQNAGKPVHPVTTGTAALDQSTASAGTGLTGEQANETAGKEKGIGKTPDEIEKEEKELDAIERASRYVPVIMDPEDQSVPRMKCPAFNSSRYEHLKVSKWDRQYKYFFALNLRQCEYILPRLLGSVVEAIRFLGPESAVLSVVEGNSDDGTAEILAGLKKPLAAHGITYFYLNSDISPSGGRRIEHLAQLRNLALRPLVNSRRSGRSTGDKSGHAGGERVVNETATTDTALRRFASRRESRGRYIRRKGSDDSQAELWGTDLDLSDDATVVFLNDVAICTDDILELLHQRAVQKADMTCAMDWSHLLNYPTFYDAWVARQINGDSFFRVPTETGGWEFAHELFFNDPTSKARFDSHVPLQVYACWNGAVAFSAAPVASGEVRFRGMNPGECSQGEPTLFCKDMWFKGHGRIAVVPSVNLEYDNKNGARIKKKLGHVGKWVAKEGSQAEPLLVPWRDQPPDQVRCMPTWKEQSWRPWNETLV